MLCTISYIREIIKDHSLVQFLYIVAVVSLALWCIHLTVMLKSLAPTIFAITVDFWPYLQCYLMLSLALPSQLSLTPLLSQADLPNDGYYVAYKLIIPQCISFIFINIKFIYHHFSTMFTMKFMNIRNY